MKRQCDLCLKHFAPEKLSRVPFVVGRAKPETTKTVQFNVCAHCAELIAAQNAAPYSAIKITL